jgi:hypothetical protein
MYEREAFPVAPQSNAAHYYEIFLVLFDLPQIVLISTLYAAANSFRYATSFSTPDSGIAL